MSATDRTRYAVQCAYPIVARFVRFADRMLSYDQAVERRRSWREAERKMASAPGRPETGVRRRDSRRGRNDPGCCGRDPVSRQLPARRNSGARSCRDGGLTGPPRVDQDVDVACDRVTVLEPRHALRAKQQQGDADDMQENCGHATCILPSAPRARRSRSADRSAPSGASDTGHRAACSSAIDEPFECRPFDLEESGGTVYRWS